MRTKKEKNKKEVEFNLSNYDYLDKASLDEWVSEFLSRNSAFCEDVKKLRPFADEDPYEKDFFKKYMVIPAIDHRLKGSTASTEVRLLGPVLGLRIDRGGESRFGEHFTIEDFLDMTIGKKGGNYRGRDVLLLAINLNAPQEEIKNEVEEWLKENKTREVKLRKEKWKYYLIAYDLRQAEPSYSYKEIAIALSSAYPGDKNLFDEKNCENYYRRALDLINGGYKKYI